MTWIIREKIKIEGKLVTTYVTGFSINNRKDTMNRIVVHTESVNPKPLEFWDSSEARDVARFLERRNYGSKLKVLKYTTKVKI